MWEGDKDCGSEISLTGRSGRLVGQILRWGQEAGRTWEAPFWEWLGHRQTCAISVFRANNVCVPFWFCLGSSDLKYMSVLRNNPLSGMGLARRPELFYIIPCLLALVILCLVGSFYIWCTISALTIHIKFSYKILTEFFRSWERLNH